MPPSIEQIWYKQVIMPSSIEQIEYKYVQALCDLLQYERPRRTNHHLYSEHSPFVPIRTVERKE